MGDQRTVRAGVRRSHDSLMIPAALRDNPCPPFQITGVSMIYLEGRLPEGTALPAGLTLAASRFASIGLYRAAEGWGIAPYHCSNARVAVAGLDAPDGSEAFLHLTGCATGRAGEVLPRIYHSGWRAVADLSLLLDGPVLEAHCDLGQDCRVQFRGDVTDEPPIQTAGVHRELGLDEHGGLREWTCAYSCRARRVVVQECRLTAPPGHILSGLRIESVWFLDQKSFTLGPPQPVALASAAARERLIRLGLSAGEARVALTLGRGGTAGDAATELGLSPHTVRSTLKTVYAKLGIRGRAELGALIAGG